MWKENGAKWAWADGRAGKRAEGQEGNRRTQWRLSVLIYTHLSTPLVRLYAFLPLTPPKPLSPALIALSSFQRHVSFVSHSVSKISLQKIPPSPPPSPTPSWSPHWEEEGRRQSLTAAAAG